MILENFYHGSPYEFDHFDISKVGSGDSHSKFGWGLYFTDSPNTALKYAQELSIGKLKEAGFNIYEVKLLGIDSFYQWDAEIPESVAEDVYKALISHGHENNAEQFQTEIQEYGLWTMDSLYQYLEAILGSKKEASEFLYNFCDVNGVIGQTGWLEGNVYVAFSDSNVKIINHMKSDDMLNLDEVRSVVREFFGSQEMNEEVLEEDYYSVKEIKELANETILHLAKINFDAFIRQVKSDRVDYVMPVTLLEVYQENPRKFPTLGDFLVNTKIFVKVARMTSDGGTLGHYTYIKEPEYDKEKTREILLYPREGFYQELTDKYSKEGELDYQDAYFTMWYAFHSTLEHEIQHAYDDYRSNSKLFQARKSKEYDKNHTMANGRTAVYASPERNAKKYQEYLKLQHEIWARFTQAINETKFTKGDFATSPEGVMYYHYQMRPITDVMKDFIIDFDGWRIMPETVKKKFASRVSAYWHKELENLDKKNQKSIDREKEVLSRKELAEARKLVREALEALSEDYPTSFDMEYFKSIKSFKNRVEYCNTHLKRLASGSSRTVYQIDEKKVLKLAISKRGIVQNETEIDRGQDTYYSDILAEVYDYDENGLWVEMELAKPVGKKDFKKLVGVDFEYVKLYLINFQSSNNGKGEPYRIPQELVAEMDENFFVQRLRDFIAGTDALAADLGKPDSIGVVNRGGEPELVLIDFGLTEKDFAALYEYDEPIEESNNTSLWTYGGIVLIKGKEVDGMQNLYACHIISLVQLDRKKVDNTPGKSARMVILDANIFRIVNDNGQLRALKVDWKTAASLSRMVKFNGRQSHAVTLNNNKTPIHWETLKYNNFPQLFKNVGLEIMNIPGIKFII